MPRYAACSETVAPCTITSATRAQRPADVFSRASRSAYVLPDSRRRSPSRTPTELSHVDTPRADRDELIRDRDTGHCLIGGRGSARLPRSLLRAGHLRPRRGVGGADFSLHITAEEMRKLLFILAHLQCRVGLCIRRHCTRGVRVRPGCVLVAASPRARPTGLLLYSIVHPERAVQPPALRPRCGVHPS